MMRTYCQSVVTIFRISLGVLILALNTNELRSQVTDNQLLQKVVVNYDSIIFVKGEENVVGEPQFPNSSNDLLFYLDAGETDQYFSFFLSGYDKEWSPWTPFPVKEYTNLGAGDYELRVRTGVRGTISGEQLLFRFRISYPVMLQPIFLAGYLLLLVFLLVVLYRVLIHRHIRKQAELEELVMTRTEELTEEKERTETLLANVLPKGTADEIMSKGKATKKKFNFATVLFSDIQGFTKIAEEVNPEILIDELDRFFFYFDSVVEKYNIEKIKTIGDAYMCAGGIPKSNRTNPIEVILAALEMQSFMERLKADQQKKGQIFWDIRIGLHTGTVIAGVVGQKKLSYDIWGDTVNTASRMESSGEAGKINISGTTYEYARDFFICEYRGKMPVKYKGELDMYFVNGIRPELRQERSNEPNAEFRVKLLLIKLLDIEDEVFEEYEKRCDSRFLFHDTRYLKNITTQAELIGRAEQLADKDMIMLRLAAIFITSGRLDNYLEYLDESLRYMKEKLKELDIEDEFISGCEKVIRDSLEEAPESHVGMILSDSMHDYYGRVDLIIRLELLFAEEKHFVQSTDKKEWFKTKLEILANHRFKTGTARLLRTNPVEKQVEILGEYISAL